MNRKMLNPCALAATVVAAFVIGDFAAATTAMAQVGPYAYVPGYPVGPGTPFGAIIGSSNPSVPFDPGAAAFSLRYGKAYGFCGFTITGC